MKSKFYLILLISLLIPVYSLNAQEKKEESKGAPIIVIFGNFHSNFSKENPQMGFELNRAYLGYQHNFSKSLAIKAVMDIGESKDISDYQRIAYIKNAQITWKHNDFTLNGGLISTIQYNELEKFLGYRYIMRSFQDEYKFGHSADLGVSASYKFGEILLIDAIVSNGEGYKKLQSNNKLQYGIGASITPLKGLLFRAYTGLHEDNVNFSFFTGYKTSFFTLAGEYNIIKNQKHGVSIYGSMKLNQNLDLYARYNLLETINNSTNLNESGIVSGVQYLISDKIKISPNIRIGISDADNLSYEDLSAYISCYFAL